MVVGEVNEEKIIYEMLITLQEDIKDLKKDINNSIEETNIKIAKLEANLDMVLKDRSNYDELNAKVNILNNEVKNIVEDNDSNKSLKQSVIVGICVFVLSYLIKFIH